MELSVEGRTYLVTAAAPRTVKTGDVLGRSLFVMERVAGSVYEMEAPKEPDVAPDGVKRMCISMAEQIAAIHSVDLVAVQLDSLDQGRNHLDREIAHWASEMERVKRGPLPALERLLHELKNSQPPPCARASRWCTVTPSRATSPSSGTKSVRCSIGS